MVYHAAMSTITFDTLKFVDRLEKAGASRELATAMAEAQKEAFAETLDTSVATKADLATLKTELKLDIVRLENRIESMELRLTIKLGAFLAVFAGIIIAALKAV